MKLLSFIPDNIHVVRRSINDRKIIAQDHGEHVHLFPYDGGSEIGTVEEKPVIAAVQDPVVSGSIASEPAASEPAASEPAASEPAVQPVFDKEARRNEKIAALMEKWVNMEGYVKPDINIKDVATEMGTNSNYLSTYLNRVLDTSFATWLNTLRIEKSKEYLCSDMRLSVEECGLKSGYTSLYNYSRWFKTITGMSPSAWRKNRCDTKVS